MIGNNLNKFLTLLTALLTAILIITCKQNAFATCTGRIVNPITDICWDCIFPISIGAIETPPSNNLRPDTENFPFPI
jgi:conjugal transfer pilus assembly protein TraU